MNTQIISPADTVVKTLFGENQNPVKWGNRGFLRALLSDQNGDLRNQLSPECKTGGKVSRNNAGVAQIRVDYAPLIENLTVNAVLTCTGNVQAVPFEIPFTIGSHRNLPQKITSQQVWSLQCDVEDTLQAKYGDPLGSMATLKAQNYETTGFVSMQLYRTLDNLIKNVNTDVMIKAFVQRGVNAIYGSNAVQNLTLGSPTVTGGMFPKLLAELKKIRRKNRTCGKFLVIGGDIWAEHLDYLAVSAPNNQQSIDYSGTYISALRTEMDFFYDEDIDTLLGAGVALILAPNMVGMPIFGLYNYMEKITGGTMNADNVSYRTAYLPEWQTCNKGQDNFLPIDVMVKVETCNPADGNLPSWTIIPSINYELYSVPTGTRFTSGPLNAVNGIYAYRGI